MNLPYLDAVQMTDLSIVAETTRKDTTIGNNYCHQYSTNVHTCISGCDAHVSFFPKSFCNIVLDTRDKNQVVKFDRDKRLSDVVVTVT